MTIQATTEIVRRGLYATRRSLIGWSVGIVAFIAVNLAFWPSLEGSDALAGFEEMESLLEAFGAQNIATPAGYVDGQVYALLVPLLLSAMMITVVSGLTAGDEYAGRLELLHALPVSRRSVWLGRWFALIGMLFAVAVISLVATIVALPIFSLTEVGVGRIVGATAGSALLAAFHGSVVYAAAGFGLNRGAAAGAGVIVLVAGYLASFVLPLADALADAREWSPWYWAIGDQPVSNGISLGRLSLVAVVTIVLVAIGTVAVDRRDIRTA